MFDEAKPTSRRRVCLNSASGSPKTLAAPAVAVDATRASQAGAAKIEGGGASTLQSGRIIAITRGVNLDGSYVSSTFGTVKNLRSPETTSREGLIDAAFLLDVSGHVKLRENLKLIAGVQNLLEREYITSRLPEGPRSGAPRQFFIGFEFIY